MLLLQSARHLAEGLFVNVAQADDLAVAGGVACVSLCPLPPTPMHANRTFSFGAGRSDRA